MLAFAANKITDDGNVAVTPVGIRGYTGISCRYAYDLVESIGAEISGVAVRESQQVTTGSGTERKGKPLLVDCEQFHEVSESVKQFTTQNGAGGGE